MSKNLIVLFIVILLIVGGFAIYTYDQSNQAKKEVEEKNLKLETKDALVLELKENIQEKEKQIEELKANLEKGGEDLEKEYVDKLSELTEEKAKLEVLLTEKEEIINTIEKQKEESEQIVLLKDELISELKENIQEKEKQIEELKASLAKGEKDLEKEYDDKLSELTEEKAKLEALLAEKERIWLDKEKEKQQLIVKLEEEVKGHKENINKLENEIVNLKEEAAKLAKGEKDLEKEYDDKLSELTEEKAKLEALLAEKEETIKTIIRQKEESEQIVFSKDELISELKGNIQEKEKQIGELKVGLTKEEKDLEKEYDTKISELMKEKGQLEALLIEQEGISQTKDREKEELISKLENYNNQINELKDKLVQQEIEEEKDYVAKLSALTEEKSKLETQLKTSQGLLSEKESTITVLKQQNEESEKNIVEKDTTIAELSESIRGYENQIKEISEQAAKEEEKEIEKETEYSIKLSLLSEEKSKLETQLKASQELLLERENTIVLFKQQKEDSEKVISGKDKTIAELSESIKGYENLVTEIREQMAQEGKEKEAEYTDRLTLLTEEKSKLETQLKASQELLSEKESIITALKEQNEESEKNIVDKDKAIAELSESIKGYGNLVKEIQEQMAQEGKEKEAEYADRLALLKEGKGIMEAKLAEAIKKSIPDYYEVEKGDSLWNIAERFYSTGEKWIRIFEANTDKIKNPDMIYPYQRFTIPKE